MTASQSSYRFLGLTRGAMLATGAVAAVLVSGCSTVPHPEKLAEQAREAMHNGRNVKAIALSEQAVHVDGRNAGLRLLLANAYLRGGRFESSRAAYADAIALGDDSSRAALGLALSDLALGRNRAALDTLNAYSDVIPAADLGLALVMTGQNERGLTVLTAAVRSGHNGPKVRQNLAYAYALSGFWAEARTMAGQDIPADQVDGRLASWAAMIGPDDGRRRVAAMVNAPLVGDTGQPEALALSHFPAIPGEEAPTAKTVPVQAAAAELAPVPPAQAQPSQTAVAASDALARIDLPASRTAAAPPATTLPTATLPAATHHTAELPVVAPAAAPSATLAAVLAPAPVALPPVAQTPRLAVARPARIKVAMVVPPVKGMGTHVVQIGAYNSDESARRAWQHFQSRHSALAGHPSLVTKVNVRGHDFWRLQAAGFGAHASASSACVSLRAHGGACFVMAMNVAGQVSGVQTAAAQPVAHAPQPAAPAASVRLSMNIAKR